MCKRSINEYDDEFSIGLIAFNEAIEKYTPEKGKSILSFAQTVITNRVIDYIRKEAKDRDGNLINFSTQDVDHYETEYGKTTATTKIEVDISIGEYNRNLEKNERQDEIQRFKDVLKDFKVDLTDLYEKAPKHSDARKNALLVAQKLINTDNLKEIFWTSKKLPIKNLIPLVQVSKVTIERNRKYIIALAIIIDGDYTFLKEYLKK